MDHINIAKDIRKKVLKMAFDSQEGHIGSNLSPVEILVCLYFKILKIDPKNPLATDRDRFILSKGHAVSVLYATLSRAGFFPENILEDFCKNGCRLASHSTMGAVPGIEVSTGSLGHGLPMATGIALAGKMDKKDYRSFVLLSDGECQEGSNWEAILFAGNHKLDNLVAIVDYNKIQALGTTKEVSDLEPFKDKWESFGWSAKVIDGHNFKELDKAFSSVPFKKGRPSVIICDTVKGKGVSFMENKLEWHYNHLSKEDFEKAIKEI